MFNFLRKKSKEDNSSGVKPAEGWSHVVEKGVRQYDSLTSSERIWFNVRGIIDSTNGGGLISYYYNSGAENVDDAITDLKSIGFEKVAGIIEKYNNILFKGNVVPKDIQERNRFIHDPDDETDDLLQSLENDLAALMDELEKQLELFLRQEKLIE